MATMYPRTLHEPDLKSRAEKRVFEVGNALPPDADKTVAVAQERTGVPMRVLLREETLDLLLEQIAHLNLAT